MNNYINEVDKEIISIYDLAKFIKNNSLDKEEKRIKEKYKNYFEETLEHFYHKTDVSIFGIDKFRRLKMGFGFSEYRDFDKIFFIKYNDKLIIQDSETSHDSMILSCFGNRISDLYDELSLVEQKKYDIKLGINTINSKFKIDIKSNGIDVYNDDIKVSNTKDDYIIECNYNDIINEIKHNEKELFKKLFVKIDDCPKWMIEELCDIRSEQVVSKQKKLSFINRFRKVIKR